MVSSIKNTVPSFAAARTMIIDAQRIADNASLTAEQVKVMAFTQFIDACNVAGIAKTEASCTALGNAIRASFADDVDNMMFEKATVTNYAQSAMRAFYHGAAWYASAFKSEDKGGLPALPWSKGGKAKSPKAGGKIKTTDRAELDKTIAKMLEQARLLGLTEFAAEVLDVCIESLDNFTE